MTHGVNSEEEWEEEKEGLREGGVEGLLSASGDQKGLTKEADNWRMGSLGHHERWAENKTKWGSRKGCHAWVRRLCTAPRAEGVSGSGACWGREAPFQSAHGCHLGYPGPRRRAFQAKDTAQAMALKTGVTGKNRRYKQNLNKKRETAIDMLGLPWCFWWWRVRLQLGRPGFSPWVGKIPWRRKWQPTPVFLPGESPWTREPGGLQSGGSQRVRHDWATNTFTFTDIFTF